MTDIEAFLAERERIHGAATKGEWHYSERGFGKHPKPTVFATDSDLRYIAVCSDAYCVGERTDNESNAKHIADAHNHLPRLIAAMRVLDAALDKISRDDTNGVADADVATDARAEAARILGEGV